MSPDQMNPRGQRRRVLLVGGADARCRLSGDTDYPVLRAANLFDAIGELSTAPAREPIALLLLTPDLLNGASDRILEKIRRLDPGVRIGIVQDDASSACPIDSGAFDLQLNAPVSEADIRKWLEGDMAEQPTAATAVDSVASPSRNAAHAAEESVQPVPARPPSSSESPSSVSEPPIESLGDIDLVTAALDHTGSILPLALRMIEQQTGWRSVELAAGSEEGHGAPVQYGAQGFGRLCTPDAAPADLTRWAEWLAHWLALEASQRRYRYLAYHDELTGAWNRRYFMTFLAESIDRAMPRRRPITVMVFDIDDFKKYNDTFGHSAGDEILRETVRLLTSVIRQDDLVCRIGGDEFAVVFADIDGPREPGSQHPESIEQIARRFQDEICRMHFPKLGIEAPGTLSISGGLATYPWDGHDPASLLEHADQLALESKQKGKNIITLGPGAQKNCCHPTDSPRDLPRDPA